jgi:hypothetical protein
VPEDRCCLGLVLRACGPSPRARSAGRSGGRRGRRGRDPFCRDSAHRSGTNAGRAPVPRRTRAHGGTNAVGDGEDHGITRAVLGYVGSSCRCVGGSSLYIFQVRRDGALVCNVGQSSPDLRTVPHYREISQQLFEAAGSLLWAPSVRIADYSRTGSPTTGSRGRYPLIRNE